MKKITLLSIAFLLFANLFAQHNAGNNGKILMIASNPTISKTTGWPIGVWYAELTHPYWVFNEAGYTVDIASLDGGEIKFDGFSDPEDESKYAQFDYISLGFKKDTNKMALTKNTLKLSTVNPNDYKAIFVCGGQGPMYTMYKNSEILQFVSNFYQTGKPTAAICHGTCVLLDAKLPNGKYLVEGKKWTGFANSEENYADSYVGKKIQPFRIEDEARKMPNSKFVVAHMFDAFALRDGNLITGQQQNSGAKAAELVLDALEEDKNRYSTYVLVHGAWADESAWGFVRNDLAKNANVVVVNLPAHGADNTYGVGIGLNNYVKTVSEVINKINGKVILVGHSMAGVIISQVAENMPNKIDKLIYVAAYLPKNGEDVSSITNTFLNNKPIEVFEFNKDYSLVSIKKEAIATVVCADCPDYMKDVLVKYHRAEPVKGLNDKVTLTAKFNAVPKYYISTKNDYAVPYALQQQMIKANGTVKNVFEMETSHLPFVVKPAEFLNILNSINNSNNNKIIGKWKSESTESNGNGTFGIREFVITENNWEVKFTLYLDKQATKPAFTFRGTGMYSLVDNSSNVKGATNAIFYFDHKFITLKTSDADIIKNFGFIGLEINKEKDITEKGLSFIESKSACGQEFDLVSIQNGKLYLGERPAQGKNICAKENRPLALGLPLIKIK